MRPLIGVFLLVWSRRLESISGTHRPTTLPARNYPTNLEVQLGHNLGKHRRDRWPKEITANALLDRLPNKEPIWPTHNSRNSPNTGYQLVLRAAYVIEGVLEPMISITAPTTCLI
jgi:hypothetical protein